MRGKPIELVTKADLDLLISDGVAEDRRLEFKLDVPVSLEAQKAHAKSGSPGLPVDRSWAQGKSLADFGRDALAEEIVAFANADGGTLILGMDETTDPPPRPKRINALPDVAGLERRLRDILATCVEPRLPYVAVKAIQTQPDGSGVVLIETSASVLGPHWVRKTRKPTIRREDRCDPLTMPEIHDMVLRNARGRETTIRQAEECRSAFLKKFHDYLIRHKPPNFIGFDTDPAYPWLKAAGNAALAAQITVTPHYDLALPRLEDFDGLMPSDTALSIDTSPNPRPVYYVSVYTYAKDYSKRVLGGVIAIQTGGFNKQVKALRTGQVVVSFMQIRPVADCTCWADLIVGMSAFALGVYDRLRQKSSFPSAPADVDLDICAREKVAVGGYQGVSFASAYGQLGDHLRFPTYTIGATEDITVLLEEVAADLLNAGGLPASHLPRPIFSDPH